MNVMTRAWEIARAAVTTHGGKAREYIAEALRMAWVETKEVPHFGYFEISKVNGVLYFAVDNSDDLQVSLLSSRPNLMGKSVTVRKPIGHREVINNKTGKPARIYDVSFGNKIEFVRGGHREVMTIDRGHVMWA